MTREQESNGEGRRAMTLSEKILCHHAIGLTKPEVKPGDMICVKVDWTLASEVTWMSMDQTYDQMGRPRIWRNDRFWLAIDHTVDPRNMHEPTPQKLIKASESFAQEARLVDFHEPNKTILHTEFYRQRAQPGQVVVGADSHSTGGLGAFAIGLGAADVVMPLVTGETWIRVPESVLIEFAGEPPFGVQGKDVMLYTLGQLKCNTVAVERAVEWGGNVAVLSPDSRFAIANMSVEFGGIAGVFTPDERTAAYIAKRPSHKDEALYFKADPDAQYAERVQIRLDDIAPQVALYPSPDNVVPVTECAGMALDGCFIGACTTAEEELVLAGMVLEAALREGKVPVARGTRRVTPGSEIITARLRSLGLLDAYERAGFTVGAAGCSYCLAIASDKAGEGEVWLSSQNRNYRNRMGKGSIANLASAVTVAASSFDMAVTDPRPLLALIDRARFESYMARGQPVAVRYVEPAPILAGEEVHDSGAAAGALPTFTKPITGRAQVFGDNIDTDAILPGEYLHLNDMDELGRVCFEHTNPEFRQKVADGYNIVVAGRGFGCGSSREQAVTALKGCGMAPNDLQAVIARSYAYIFSRNYKNFSLVCIKLADDRFYELAAPGSEITVNMRGRTVEVGGEAFPFEMSLFEERLLAGGGIMPLFKKYGSQMFRVAIGDPDDEAGVTGDGCGSGSGKKAGGCGAGGAEGQAGLEW